MDLGTFVQDFVAGMTAADALRPQHTSRTGREYQPGIGPFNEDRAVDLTLARMRTKSPDRYTQVQCRAPYPGSRQKCDLVLGNPPVWAIEVKMARFRGDNGKPDDMAIKDLLSPFDRDRSALTDCTKLVESDLATKMAVVIYGFDADDHPLDTAIAAFEVLARVRVSLGPRQVAVLGDLVHPVHSSGSVYGWTVERVQPRF